MKVNFMTHPVDTIQCQGRLYSCRMFRRLWILTWERLWPISHITDLSRWCLTCCTYQLVACTERGDKMETKRSEGSAVWVDAFQLWRIETVCCHLLQTKHSLLKKLLHSTDTLYMKSDRLLCVSFLSFITCKLTLRNKWENSLCLASLFICV
jgi:hypothetical protein